MKLDTDLFNIDLTKDAELVRSVVTTPKLYELAIGDGTPVEEWRPEVGSVWLHGTYDGDTVGVIKLEGRGVMVEWHWYVKPEFWGTEMPDLMEYEVIEWFRENTPFVKVMGTCPSTCPHTIQAGLSHGMTSDGYIKDGMVWKNELVDMVILTKQIQTLDEMNDKYNRVQEKDNGR